jgi:hypothetical protein
MDQGMARARDEVRQRWPDRSVSERKKLASLVRRRNYLDAVLATHEDDWDKAEHSALVWILGRV